MKECSGHERNVINYHTYLIGIFKIVLKHLFIYITLNKHNYYRYYCGYGLLIKLGLCLSSLLFSSY